jgi:peptidoglycan/xylan/chitin deacetylase (PgdA/CDA1 family)|tara:strand:+ start:3450 stop:4406 length:957 start_codon:yes stop_codon:yes gene_type:complete
MSGNSPIILLYHQVSPENTKFIENYNINVKPNLFDEHMKILKNEYAPITFEEWNEAIKNDDDVSDRVLVTFDDGYKDVINYGAEILDKHNLDGIWFINGGMVNNDKVFWLSQLMYLYDNNYLDNFLNEFNLDFPGLLKPINLNNLPVKDVDMWAKDNYSKTLDESLNKYILGLGWNEMIEANRNSIYANSKELKTLSESFVIGNHTLSHPNFRNLSIEDKIKESEESRNILENIIDKKINTFAFPFGQEHFHWCQNDVNILQNLNYDFIFSVANNIDRTNADVIHRHEILEFDGSEFKTFLNDLHNDWSDNLWLGENR